MRRTSVSNPFLKFHFSSAVLYGRKSLLASIHHRLIEGTPEHTSLVGPKYIGKSAILNHMIANTLGGSDKFLAVGYWDVGHLTPSSDSEMTLQLGQKIKELLKPTRSDLADWLKLSARDEVATEIDTVLGQLGDEEQRLCILMDGFDRLLTTAAISKNQWDILAMFAQKGSVTLVTASRSPLRELCKYEESNTSDFWALFGTNPISVGPLDENDIDEFVKPFDLRKIEFDKSARTELSNWTGGVPILVSALMRDLYEACADGSCIDNTTVNNVAERLTDNEHTSTR